MVHEIMTKSNLTLFEHLYKLFLNVLRNIEIWNFISTVIRHYCRDYIAKICNESEHVYKSEMYRNVEDHENIWIVNYSRLCYISKS